MRVKHLVTFAFLGYFIVGCDIHKYFPGGLTPPDEAMAELRQYAVTITPAEGPFPSAVERITTNYNGIDYIEFSDDRSRGIDAYLVGVEGDYSGPLYSLVFSRGDDESGFEPILAAPQAAELDSYNIELMPVVTDNSSLSEFGDFYWLSTPLPIPTSATHIEIYKRGTGESGVPIHRYPLSTFYAWRRYVAGDN